MYFTIDQWVIVALVFVLGWLLGMMSRSGGKRWKRELAEEREAHRAYRHDTEARLTAADRDRPVVGPAAHEPAGFRKDGRPL